MVSNMKGTPKNLKQGVQESSQEEPGWQEAVAEERTAPEEEMKARPRMYLKRRDYKRYGYTRECAGCIRMARKAPPPYYHNSECRERIETSVQRYDPQRWKRAQLRRDAEDLKE